MSADYDGTECAALLAQMGIQASSAETEFYRGHVESMLRILEDIDDEPPTAARRGWRAPAPDENPLGAWHRLGVIQGAPSGPLAGRTIALKDNILLAGVPLANGTPVLDGYVPDTDAEIVRRVLAAGARIVGKTVCEAYCCSGGSHTSASGPVRNPKDPLRSAGGSSSGSAAVVASGAADMAIGCDQGGSIRIPASYCGIYGMKPTWGLVPYTGVLGMNFMIDHAGPMTADVADNARLLEVLAGPDGADPRQHGARVDEYTAALGRPITGVRIGLLTEGFSAPGSDPRVGDCVRAAAAALARMGAVVCERPVPVHATAARLSLGAVQAIVASMFEADGCPIEQRVPVDAGYVRAQRNWRARVNELPVNVKAMLVFGAALRQRHGYEHLARAFNRLNKISAHYDAALREVDLLVLPTTPTAAPLLPPPGAPPQELLSAAHGPAANTGIFNHTHHPAMSVPCGTRGGMPVGMMLVGRHFEEALIYSVAHAFEQTADWRRAAF
ncbi:MAG: amidase [Gammaproteobacteria bacterium]